MVQLTGRWYLVAISQIIAVYIAIKQWSFWLLFLVLPLFIYCYRQKKKGRFYLLVIVSSFFIFFLYTTVYDHFNVTHLKEDDTEFIGTISTSPMIDGDRIVFQMDIENETVQVRYYLQTEGEKQQLSQLMVGMTCHVTGTLQSPQRATNFYAFDYAQHLYFQRIHWLLTPTSIKLENCHSIHKTPLNTIQQYRQKGIQTINEYFPDELKGMAAALIYGERHFIEENVLHAYEVLGVVHLLAVSGLHVGLIVTALFYILLRIGITKERVYELLIALLPIYVVIAGAAPSAIRASFMTIVVLICLRLKKQLHPLDGISWIFIGYVLLNPYVLFHIGFQLSFLISFSLILSANTIFTYFTGYFKPLLAVTIQSQFIALPVIFYNFYEISWLSIPLNIVYIPFISIMILPSVFLLFFIVLIFPKLAQMMMPLLESLLTFAHEMLTIFEQIPFTMITVGKISKIEAILLFCIVVYGCYQFEKQKQWQALIIPTVLLVMFITALKVAPYLNPHGEVTFIDVGQGDSILIELPFRKAVYLIDTGGQVSYFAEEWRQKNRSFDVGRDIVTPYLKAKGIDAIDKLILTHGDFDHIGGADEIRKAFHIKEVYYPVGNVEGDYEKGLLMNFHENNVPIHFVNEGVNWQVRNQAFYIVSPTGHEQEKNDRSIAIYAQLGGMKWLFTGDLEEDGERRIINDYPTLLVDILKVGHHGSRTSTSSDFLKHIKPKVAIISVGRNNRFQHPHKEVIDSLHSHNVKVFRTDQHGAIRFIFNHERLKKVERALE